MPVGRGGPPRQAGGGVKGSTGGSEAHPEVENYCSVLLPEMTLELNSLFAGIFKKHVRSFVKPPGKF